MIHIDIHSIALNTNKSLQRQIIVKFLHRRLPLVINMHQCEGLEIPPFYGIVRRLEDYDEVILALIPFNIPLALFFWFYGFARFGWYRFLRQHIRK